MYLFYYYIMSVLYSLKKMCEYVCVCVGVGVGVCVWGGAGGGGCMCLCEKDTCVCVCKSFCFLQFWTSIQFSYFTSMQSCRN